MYWSGHVVHSGIKFTKDEMYLNSHFVSVINKNRETAAITLIGAAINIQENSKEWDFHKGFG